MEYFIMQTDSRMRRLPQFQAPKELLSISGAGQANRKDEVSVIYVTGNKGLNIEYPDYISGPIPLIADRLHKILKKYQQDAIFHQVVLIEKDKGTQRVYYMMIPPSLECADKSKTAYDRAGNVLDFVLDAECIGRNKIFRVSELKNQIAVRLDVAESILRRNVGGIWFEPLKQ